MIDELTVYDRRPVDPPRRSHQVISSIGFPSPICIDGSPLTVFTRPGSDPRKWTAEFLRDGPGWIDIVEEFVPLP